MFITEECVEKYSALVIAYCTRRWWGREKSNREWPLMGTGILFVVMEMF